MKIQKNKLDLILNNEKDFWNELTSSQQQDILESIFDLDSGRKTSLEKVLKKLEKK